MNTSLERIITALSQYEPHMTKDERVNFSEIMANFEKYLSYVLVKREANLKSPELALAIEATLNVSIAMLKGIDSGIEGLDDRLAQEFGRIKTKYLGL